jgi:hypothetical protein
MKIYDCFTFYNEFDLLDLRIAEMYDHVDYMVLVEANHTFQNEPKHFNFKHRMKEYEHLDKLIYIGVEDMPLSPDPWTNERHQRDSIMLALDEAADDDLIIISDIDEILRPSTIAQLRQGTSQIYGFRLPLFNFKYNYMLVTQDCYSVWNGAIKKGLLESPEDFRRQRHTLNTLGWQYSDSTVSIIEHAGWHFTYLGGDDFARNKIRSFAHADDNRPEVLNQIDVEESIRQGRGIKLDNGDYLFKPVKIDDYLPITIVNNQDTYAGKVLPAEVSAREYLPK